MHLTKCLCFDMVYIGKFIRNKFIMISRRNNESLTAHMSPKTKEAFDRSRKEGTIIQVGAALSGVALMGLGVWAANSGPERNTSGPDGSPSVEEQIQQGINQQKERELQQKLAELKRTGTVYLDKDTGEILGYGDGS